MADGEQAPDPRAVRDSAGFVARLQALMDWSGLTCGELAARAEAAGDVLPRSSVANMLAGSTVPGEDLLQAFVRACGAGPEALEHWLAVREELAVRGRHGGTGGQVLSWPGASQRAGPASAPGMAPAGEAAAAEAAGGGDGSGGRGGGGSGGGGASAASGASPWRRLAVPVPAVLALVVAAFTVVTFVRGDDPGHRVTGAGVTAPSAGPVRIRAVHSGLCLDERRGRESGRVYQVACGGAEVPRYSLVPLAGGLWRLHSDRPGAGTGCAGFPVEAAEQDGAPLVDQECGRRGPRETFRIETFAGPGGGHRIRSAHSGLCLEVRDGSSEPWTDVVQRPCDDTGAGQLFSFDRRRE
ncbi:RICIN domain-containing protein [Streptomyces gobitricini]